MRRRNRPADKKTDGLKHSDHCLSGTIKDSQKGYSPLWYHHHHRVLFVGIMRLLVFTKGQMFQSGPFH